MEKLKQEEFITRSKLIHGDGHLDYEELTGLNEEKEVLLRVGDILQNIILPKYFVIGNTDIEKRIKIYKHILLLVFPNYNVEMSYCEGFKNDKGLYIWKNSTQ